MLPHGGRTTLSAALWGVREALMVSPPWPADMGPPEAEATRSRISLFLLLETALPQTSGSTRLLPVPTACDRHPRHRSQLSPRGLLGSRLFPVHEDRREDLVLWPTFPASPGSTAAQGDSGAWILCVEPLWSTPQFLLEPGEPKPVCPLWGAGWLPWTHLPLSLSSASCIFLGWGWPC